MTILHNGGSYGRVPSVLVSYYDEHTQSTLKDPSNEHLIRHPAATFFVRVDGDSMRDAGVASGDILVVDRALEAKDGSIVVAALDGELTVKRLRRRDGKLLLVPENPDYKPVEVAPEASFMVWGVVTYIIHKA